MQNKSKDAILSCREQICISTQAPPANMMAVSDKQQLSTPTCTPDPKFDADTVDDMNSALPIIRNIP